MTFISRIGFVYWCSSITEFEDGEAESDEHLNNALK
jgi:hypothetical protein